MFISAKTCDSQLRKKTDIVQLSIATSRLHTLKSYNYSSSVTSYSVCLHKSRSSKK